jgi:ABC-2 type transport system permease protein
MTTLTGPPPQRTHRDTPLLLPALSLTHRELIRFLRQRHRIIGALATPVVVWLLIGGGMGRSFSSPGLPDSSNYIQFFFPGTILMILLFTAIFSTISIIEDRREGFLQSVLVAPVSRMSIVLGKVLGGTILAFGQGFLFLLLAPTVGIHLSLPGLLIACLTMLLLSFSLTCLGFCIAWRMTSTQGFHAIMNLFLMPLWFLSGALFPPQGAWRGLSLVMNLNPLSYGLAALRRSLHYSTPITITSIPSLPLSLGISIAFAVIMFALATLIATSPSKADLA